MKNPYAISRSYKLSLSALFILLLSSCVRLSVPTTPEMQKLPPIQESASERVRSGLEVFLAMDHSRDSLQYGLLANQTCVNYKLVHGVELLKNVIDLELLLSPEHGLFGAENAGDQIGDETDAGTGIRSLTTYGRNPDQIAELIANLDVVLFDIQDIGIRSYTYINSMAYLMRGAAKAGVKVVILDRPNPINGIRLEGNILDPEFSSFVGLYPIPYRHGMTIGELALFFNQEFGINCKLEVIPMDGWKRDMWYRDTGLPWIPTSPHVPDAETILPMIATGTYGELGMLSEGVGTTIPFELVGGPWIKFPQTFAKVLNARISEGVIFRPTFFKPYYGRHKGEICGGVQIHVTDKDRFSPYIAGLVIMSVHQELYPEIDLFQNQNRWGMFAKVMGTDQFQKALQVNKDPVEMQMEWQSDLKTFDNIRQEYLLYE
ncbi:MAG: DUF1343 domain-containing protein [Candidatus Marinimicrobia bacterium]|nr:DUF1343 domain-containing protein [Candidatus Neomarinimicrobiota bacterium]